MLQMGLAVNGRQKDEGGNWIDKPNFFDIKVFGNQAETLAQHLEGPARRDRRRSDWSSWEAQDGSKRSKVEIVAFTVQFLDSRSEGGGEREYVLAGDIAADRSDFGLRRAPTTTSRSRADQGVARQMAREQTKGRRRPPGGGPPTRRQSCCYFCKDKVDQVDYKNTNQLRRQHLREGQDPLAPDCRRLPAPPGAGRSRGRRTGDGALPYVESR